MKIIERFHLLFVSDVRTVYENFVSLFYFRCGVLFSLKNQNLSCCGQRVKQRAYLHTGFPPSQAGAGAAAAAARGGTRSEAARRRQEAAAHQERLLLL